MNDRLDDLRTENLAIERELFDHATRFRAAGDLRWFFTYSHGGITRRILRNIANFENPRLLLKFNAHFAGAYLRSLAGQPSEEWKRAFAVCFGLALADNVRDVPFETEMCGSAMAWTHIRVDIRRALDDVGCIPAQDFSDIWEFVRQASDDAMLCHRPYLTAGMREFLQEKVVTPFVRNWRNDIYEGVCRVPVPNVDPGFVSKLESETLVCP